MDKKSSKDISIKAGGSKNNMSQKQLKIYSDEWVKYLEKNLAHIEGIIWADSLKMHIELQNTEIGLKA